MRRARLDYPGAIQLVKVQGRPDQSIFFPGELLSEPHTAWARAADLQFWTALITRACDREGARLHGYAWLPNEAVMLVQRSARPLDLLMATLCGQFSRYLHTRGRVSPGTSPYRSRYESIVISPEILPHAVRHVCWEPAKQTLCTGPDDYPFCSYPLHVRGPVPAWFETRTFQEHLGNSEAGPETRSYFLLQPEDPEHARLLTDTSVTMAGPAPTLSEASDLPCPPDLPQPPQTQASTPALDRIAAAVTRLLHERNNGWSGNRVLTKALATWYALRFTAATLERMGTYFQCRPTTLRANIESHRKRRPELFSLRMEELLMTEPPAGNEPLRELRCQATSLTTIA